MQYCYREKRTYLEVLADFPSARPPLDRLLQLIPRIQPRAFSIASSPLAHPNRLQLCVAVVKFRTPYKRSAEAVVVTGITYCCCRGSQRISVGLQSTWAWGLENTSIYLSSFEEAMAG